MKRRPPPRHPPEPLEQRIAPANLAFAFGLGNAKDQIVDDIAVDPAGNTYVAGRFQGMVDFDPSSAVQSRLALAGDTDGFVAKYDGMGALAWVAVVRDSDRAANPIHVAVSPKGEAFLYSEFGSGGTGNVSFADRLGPPAFTVSQIGTSDDVYLAKIDTTGTFQWATRYGSVGSADAQSADIAVDANGGIHLIGRAIAGGGAGSLSFDAFTTNVEAGEQNLFVVKVQDGVTPIVMWANETASPGVTATPGESDLTIAVNATGNVAIRGVTDVPLTFATPSPTTLTQNIFVASLDAAGDWAWVSDWTGGIDNDASVALDAAGDVYVLGDFTGTIDADPSAATANLTSAGLDDFFLVKLDAAGTFVFARQFGNADSNRAGELAGVDGAGNVFFTGDNIDAGIDADPGPGIVRVTGNAGVLIALDSNGAFIAADVNRAVTATDTIKVDLDGGVHRGGGFTGQINVGIDAAKTTLASKGATDFFVARYFPGDLVAQALQAPISRQALVVGGVGNQEGGKVLTDAAGNLFVAGISSGTADFEPGPGVTSAASTDPDGNIFVAKYDPAGTLAWVRVVQMNVTPFAPGDLDLAFDLGLDNAGNVYLTGEFEVAATIGSLTVPNADPVAGQRDVFVAKLDAAGTPLWLHGIGGAGGMELVESLAVNPATGVVAIGGTFTTTMDFDPGAGTANRTPVNGAGARDAYVVAFDTAGAFQWVRQLGGTGAQPDVNSIALVANGDVLAVGRFSDTVDFNLGGAAATLTAIDDDIFVARLAGADGTAVWKERFGEAGADEAEAVAVGPGDAIYVGGKFHGAVDFDPGNGATVLIEGGGVVPGKDGGFSSQGDAFLLKLAGDGSFIRAVGFGGLGEDRIDDLVVTPSGDVFAAGEVGRVADLDPGPGLARLTGVTSDDPDYVSHFTSNLDFLSARLLRDANVFADADGNVFVTGGFGGTADLDPSATARTFTSKGGTDLYVLKLAPEGEFDAAHPRTFHDANGDLVTLKLSGPGTGRFTLAGGAQHMAPLARIELAGTTLTSALTVNVAQFGSGNGATVVQRILTTQANQHLGTITLGPNIVLGNGLTDTTVDLLVTGALKGLKLRELNAGTIIRLGEDLPYDDADPKVPDTKNNFPSFAIGNVLGPDVQLVVLGKDAPLDGPNAGHGSVGDATHPGGGGLGHLVIGSWAFPGFIRTTQGIGNLTVLTGDFFCVLEIDKYHVGSTTEAGVGEMNIQEGSWGSSGSEIEGEVEAFDAEAFLAGASITAASIGAVATTEGSFDGTLILTDPDSSAVPVFTVTTDFTGTVVAASSIRRLVIKGDFTGALQAPSIGSITAYSFLGATDTFGAPTMQIEATQGALGTITATAGTVKDYEIVTDQAFKGFKVRLANLTEDAVGIDNVKITAASIGNISVSLSAKASAAADVDLTGIRDSEFTTTAIGTTKSTAGTIGNVSVTLKGGGGGGMATGLENVSFDALVGGVFATGATINTMGKIVVKISGQDGASVGLVNTSVAANSIGTTSVNVSRGKALTSTAFAVDTVDYTATGAIGAITVGGNATQTQVSALEVWAGGSVGAVTVKSTLPEFGTLADSAILAGQDLVLDGMTAAEQTAKLGQAKLGAVNLSGSLLDTDLVAGGSIGAVKVGGDMAGSRVIAGAMFGGDFTIDGDESYQRAAAIAGVSVTGEFGQSTIAAGVNPGDAIFGNSDDAIADAVSFLATTGSLGAIALPAMSTGAATTDHLYAIEAAAVPKLKIGATTLTILPLLLDLGTGGEDSMDVVVRVL